MTVPLPNNDPTLDISVYVTFLLPWSMLVCRQPLLTPICQLRGMEKLWHSRHLEAKLCPIRNLKFTYLWSDPESALFQSPWATLRSSSPLPLRKGERIYSVNDFIFLYVYYISLQYISVWEDNYLQWTCVHSGGYDI